MTDPDQSQVFGRIAAALEQLVELYTIANDLQTPLTTVPLEGGEQPW